MPSVSVMMPTFNGARYIEDAVRSILRQTFSDFELLILDDGSTDSTLDLVASIAATDNRIKIRSQSNRGIVASRNTLLDLCTSEFISVLDHDDVAPPDRLERSVDYLRNDRSCIAVGGDVEVIDSDGATLSCWELERDWRKIDQALLKGGLVIAHPAATMRTADVVAVGGYRSEYETAEDLDLFLRLAERGRVVNLPGVMVKYRVHSSNTGSSRDGVVRQADAALAAMLDAQKRRGISSSVESPPAVRLSPAGERRQWAWWAFHSGHLTTARKHAVAALKLEPVSFPNWRLLWALLKAVARQSGGDRHVRSHARPGE